jgi:hypothetical protein
MSAAPPGAAVPVAEVFFVEEGFGRVAVLAMVRILVTPDPDETLSILSSPAPGLPFLWLFQFRITSPTSRGCVETG